MSNSHSPHKTLDAGGKLGIEGRRDSSSHGNKSVRAPASRHVREKLVKDSKKLIRQWVASFFDLRMGGVGLWLYTKSVRREMKFRLEKKFH